MGGLKLTPDFDQLNTQDQWYNLSAGGGKIQLGMSYQPSFVSPHKLAALHSILHAI